MASLNKVMLIGNLGRDPEVRHTTSGTAVASFTLATNERYKNKHGDWQDKVEWHNITAWGKLAEICEKYLAKGDTAYVEGKLQTRKWKDKDDKERYTTEICIDRLQMLGGEGGRSRDRKTEDAGGNGSDDDIPF